MPVPHRAPLGPNVKKLISHRMAQLMIPEGADNPWVAGMRALSSPAKVRAYALEATRWVAAALAVVKTAPDNPYGDDDEAIAGHILQGIEERRSQMMTFSQRP